MDGGGSPHYLCGVLRRALRSYSGAGALLAYHKIKIPILCLVSNMYLSYRRGLSLEVLQLARQCIMVGTERAPEACAYYFAREGSPL
jgi:hypothetical protein